MDEIPDRVLIGTLTKRPKRKKIRKYVNTWQPRHTNVVYLHLEGKDNNEISVITGFSPAAVHNILRTPEAEEIKNRVHEKVIRGGLEGLPAKLAAIQFQAIENVAEFISNPRHKETNPFGFFDRSVKAAEMAKEMARGNELPAPSAAPTVNNTQINNIILSPEKQEAISAGLNRALEVAQAHQNLLPTPVGHLSSLKKDG